MARKRHYLPWTKKEIDHLREHYAGQTCAEMAQALGRSVDAVQRRLYILGIRKEIPAECVECAELENNKECAVYTKFLAWGSPCPARKVQRENALSTTPE